MCSTDSPELTLLSLSEDTDVPGASHWKMPLGSSSSKSCPLFFTSHYFALSLMS
jgi:hypothetical protein